MKKKSMAALLAAAAIFYSTTANAEVPNDAETLALAARIDNDSFDRGKLNIGNTVQYWMPIFDTLLVYTPDAKIVPNVAESWTYNADNTVLTIVLRAGVKFTDGTSVDANAVKANLEYLATANGPNSYMARTIKEIGVKSPQELELRLAEPDPALLYNLTTVAGALASPATLGKEGSNEHPVGSGPYVYDASASVAGRQYVYRRNPEYWNPSAFPFKQVTITPISDTVARINAISSHQVDAAIASPKEIKQATAAGLKVHLGDVDFLGLTLADREGKLNPPLADVRVRKAINLAFDRASILKFVDLGYGTATNQIFGKTSEAFLPELQDYYPYDPAKAKALLAEAGYANGFTLDMPQIGPFAAYEPIVTQQLGAIGIKVNWQKLAPGSAIPQIRSGKYPAFIFTFGMITPWSDFRQYLLPDAPFNPLKANDPKLLDLIREAQVATGDAQKAKFQAVNRYIVDKAWFAPWYRINTVYFTTPDTDVDMEPGNNVPYIRNFRPAK
ncbi:ABC transporter substrate-binding protein [Rhizobium oryzicola]|uniref:ABC transporter substrate-binding protein n=1 Tax=Rhizobium oryzicola TaxID=1232668 RepID=A0ABT8SYD0_9HYPH|nr:ABC transporter substrate-binding protein [Rhizobium oryzicola]MDO1582637.1 ABC transporter substrate-binding protein [Rhizobium oryzicola]